MKLSDIARYSELIDRLTPTNGREYIKTSLEPMVNAVSTSTISTESEKLMIHDDMLAVQQSLDGFLDSVSKIKHSINLEIEKLESAYLRNSYNLYDQGMRDDSAELILNRRFRLSDEQERFVESRIQRYGDWKYPGMIIRPGLETWINNMVALDPLYVVDSEYELMEPARQRFNPQYRDRVRWCVCREDTEHPMLDSVPDGQIGFALAYNFFHYKPFEVLRAYLTEIRNKLRPGGVLAFTFNDCDRWGAVELAERCYMCYTPGRLIKSLLENLDLEIRDFQIFNNATSWIEAARPGELTSLRGGQSLAKLIAKTDETQ